MRIAIDAMGGDFAPDEIVPGCVQAAQSLPGITRLILVGDETKIRALLAKTPGVPSTVEVMHASETIEMGESPAKALRKKKDSSIGRAIDLVKQGEADAMFSAGNTGAAVAATTLKLRTLPGVARPTIATVLPTQRHPFVLLDSGANTDCTARMLCEFAVMGDIYAREILGVSKPRVGLLSIGEEDAKGNEVTKDAFAILEKSHLNFMGNVESHDIFEGHVDVVACDGFAGNVVLKTSEAVASAMTAWLRAEFTASLTRKLGAMLLRPALRTIKRKTDPETYGGAPLLGANGLVFIGHGSSSRVAVANAIRVVLESFKHDINHHIIDDVARLPGK
jgi:glycerol-3-phosphate acyltransferase PlsX